MTRNPVTGGARRRFATVGFAALGAVVLSSGVAAAEPTAEEAQERYEQLQEELSGLNEAFNQAEEDHEAAQAELEEIQERLTAAEDELEEMSGKVAGIAQVAYTGSPYSMFTVLFGGVPDAALQNVADLDYLSEGQQDVLAGYIEEVEHSERLHAEAAETEERAAEALEEAETAQEDGEAALEEQAEVLESLGGVDPTSVEVAGSGGGGTEVAASGDVQAVLDFARAQIGKPYVWGGTGPDGYDCSGLVQAAWAQAGVNLPRTTYDQVNAGTRISRDQVQPGDLLFFYSESAPSHVGIYSGNGMMIHGSNPSKPLEEVSLAAYWDGVFTAAVRVG
ncbi:NlpC/P60 family protein [Nocardiopsis changdeensis]|uniref:C40 family peptidase n=1 Tax=Nocardiopsis changdeensis TaxID=2831969 RepID=A0ABX8BH69_9ACTN|nr:MULTISPECIES: C40 family peptidase [Nocardiopsis]QUX20188.1 C40 family peptidase [Nocardiopsis changdeensis]QYX36116.1 C40 family peptidase [Nocardiopsis sp. MT53]